MEMGIHLVPSLANILFLIKYIERWGTGTNDIISPRQANKDLNDLLEKRLIRKQGRGRAISYILK